MMLMFSMFDSRHARDFNSSQPHIEGKPCRLYVLQQKRIGEDVGQGSLPTARDLECVLSTCSPAPIFRPTAISYEYRSTLEVNINFKPSNRQFTACCLSSTVSIRYISTNPRLTCLSSMSESGSGLQAGNASRTYVKICPRPREKKSEENTSREQERTQTQTFC